MSESSEQVAVIAQGGTKELAVMKEVLDGKGIPSQIVQPPGSNPNSCGARLWLAVASQNADWAQRFLQMHAEANMTEEERKLSAQAINLDSEMATCPACTYEFNPQDTDRCPDCGLRIS